MSHVIISGGNTPGGGTPNRLEINTLIQDQVQFSLYIQALSKLPFWTYILPNRFILTAEQMPCLSDLPVTHFLIFLLAEFTVSPTCNGKALVAPVLSQEPGGMDTAPTDLTFSQLGTGPM